MKRLLFAVALIVSMSTYGSAASINLADPNVTSDFINGAEFIYSKDQPAGSGVLDSFLRIKAKGNATTEQGYNTDAANNALPLDDVPGGFTNGLLFSSLQQDQFGFYQFVLDINEENKGTESLLSLDGLKFYLTTDRFQNGPTVNGTLLWDMDAIEDSYVLLDANRGGQPGSGATDMLLRVPFEIPADTAGYLILWSQFGLQGNDEAIPGAGAGAGYEEWTTRLEEGAEPIPEPGTVLLLGAGLAGLALYHRRQRNR